jgi:retron-type reverse transcriptase
MKNLSLKMDDTIFEETEKILSKINKNRNRYINEAIEFYNLLQKRRILTRQLQKESKLVRNESMKILEEFESLENEN